MNEELKYLDLKTHELFSHLNNEKMKELVQLASYHQKCNNQIIYNSNKSIEKLYLLNRGRIKISYCRQKEVEVVSEILKEGDLFGELQLNKSENINGEFAQVLSEEAGYYSFDLTGFRNFINSDHTTAFVFSQMIAAKLKIISTKFADLFFKDVRSRVLNFLALHAKYEGVWNENKVEIDMYMNHNDIASFTASARQTVSTIINNLIKEKLIFYEGRKKLIIPDIRKLNSSEDS